MYPLLLSEAEIDALLLLVSLHRDQRDPVMAAIRQRLIDMTATIAVEPQRRMLDEMMANDEASKQQMEAWMKRMEDYIAKLRKRGL